MMNFLAQCCHRLEIGSSISRSIKSVSLKLCIGLMSKLLLILTMNKSDITIWPTKRMTTSVGKTSKQTMI